MEVFFLAGKYCTRAEDIFTPITEANCTFHHTFILSKAVELAPNDFAKASCSFLSFLSNWCFEIEMERHLNHFFCGVIKKPET